MTKYDHESSIAYSRNGIRILIVSYIVMHILCIQLFLSVGLLHIFVFNNNDSVVDAFLTHENKIDKVRTTFSTSSRFSLFLQQQNHHDLLYEKSCCSTMNVNHEPDSARRTTLFVPMSILIPVVAGVTHASKAAAAIATTTTLLSDTATTATPSESVIMKTFVDPQGLFVMNIPQRYFAIRRTNQGDLPSTATGSGRRGSSIFNAGDLSKAEVVAVERFPTRVLLEEYGIEATGNLNTFPNIGEPAAIANLIAIRRDREKPIAGSNNNELSKSRIVPDSLSVSSDGKELSFVLRTNIDVQKPDLLLEQYGVSVLNRVTAAKASLRSNDGYMMAVFASALETDWQGPDGLALQDAVKSFEVIDQSSNIV